MTIKISSSRTPADSSGVLIFLILVAFVSLPFWLIIIHAHSVEIARGRAVHMLMWAPAIAALLACRLHHISIDTLGWGWGPWRYEVAGYFLPIAYGLVAYAPLWALGLGTFLYPQFVAAAASSIQLPQWPQTSVFLIDLFLLGSFGVIQSLASALGEEIGWRGFLVPRLANRFGLRLAVAISGIIWATWHIPLIVFADYNSGTSLPFSLTCFTLMLVGTGAMAAYLRLKSGSLWPPAVLHASHNLFIQSVYDPLTGKTGHTPLWSGEFGASLAVVSLLIGLALTSRWQRHRGGA